MQPEPTLVTSELACYFPLKVECNDSGGRNDRIGAKLCSVAEINLETKHKRRCDSYFTFRTTNNFIFGFFGRQFSSS